MTATASAIEVPHAGAGLRVRRAAVPAAIVALAAVVRLVALSRVTPNPFYDAAVRSMGSSWRAFFFGALDPSVRVAVDKPPVDLWLQVASTKILGFTTPALLLPEALAGTLMVALVYDLGRTLFGRTAGIVGALVLALLPLEVITARSDTMDAVMAALVVGAAALVARAARGGRPWLVVAGGAALGLAFDVKLAEALIAMPAIAALWWLGSPAPGRARARALAWAAAAFAVIALAWPVAVTLAPGPHPWALGSTNGSVWTAIFVYDGLDRLTGGPHHVAAGDSPPAALAAAPAPPGPLRLLSGRAALGSRIGLQTVAALAALVAALALGGLRVLDRVGRAGLLAIGTWLVGGTVLFSAMHGLHPRYLEALAPAVALTAGAGFALAARRGRQAAAAATIVLAGVLAASAITATTAVRNGTSDSGRPGYIPQARAAALSSYLRARQGRARYEFASIAPAKAAQVIARDGRAALILEAYYGRPLVSARELAADVRSGAVRYALLGSRCSLASPDRGTGCSPAARWIRAHGTDVSRAAGQPNPGLVYWLRSRPRTTRGDPAIPR